MSNEQMGFILFLCVEFLILGGFLIFILIKIKRNQKILKEINNYLFCKVEVMEFIPKSPNERVYLKDVKLSSIFDLEFIRSWIDETNFLRLELDYTSKSSFLKN